MEWGRSQGLSLEAWELPSPHPVPSHRGSQVSVLEGDRVCGALSGPRTKVGGLLETYGIWTLREVRPTFLRDTFWTKVYYPSPGVSRSLPEGSEEVCTREGGGVRRRVTGTGSGGEG